jgi:phosphoglycolate phosphatase
MAAQRHLVLDFDGTLVDSKAVFIELYNALAEKAGYRPMTAENLEHLRTLSIPQRCKYLNVPLYKIPFLAAKVVKQYREKIQEIELYPGIAEMFAALEAKSISYSIISTNSKQTIEAFLKLKGIAGAKEIFCSRSVFGKDVLIKKFLKKTGLAASDIVYIGDEARDIEACRKCGVAVAWVSWGYDSAEAIKNLPPDFFLNSPAEILNLA